MRFSAGRIRQKREAQIVPMINVAFLLLIFFLLAAEIAPPEPFPVSPPEGPAEAAAASESVLWIGADGALAYRGERGEAAVFAKLTDDVPEPLRVRADGQLDAAALAGLIARLSAMGITNIELALAKSVQ